MRASGFHSLSAVARTAARNASVTSGANREFDHPEPRILAFTTIQQQLFLVTGRIRSQ